MELNRDLGPFREINQLELSQTFEGTFSSRYYRYRGPPNPAAYYEIHCKRVNRERFSRAVFASGTSTHWRAIDKCRTSESGRVMVWRG